MREKRTLPFMSLLKIPPAMEITAKMEEALSGADIVFSAVPSQFVRGTWKKAANALSKAPEAVVSLSKGIEEKTLMRMSEVIQDEFPKAKGKIAVVSGPSHAEEVARDVPTAVISASENKAVAELAQEI